jgi:predicted  nucleic acid-binding Zn-ribbon protein
MSISLQEHIDDLQHSVDVIKLEQSVLTSRLEKMRELTDTFQSLEERKRHLEMAISNLEALRQLDPDVQAALNPHDPFGDAG